MKSLIEKYSLLTVVLCLIGVLSAFAVSADGSEVAKEKKTEQVEIEKLEALSERRQRRCKTRSNLQKPSRLDRSVKQQCLIAFKRRLKRSHSERDSLNGLGTYQRI